MPRPLRQEIAGGLFHVYAQGNNGRPIYLDDRDRRLYLDFLAKTVSRMGWHCLSYCLMDTHMHLLLETPRPNLGRGMQELHGRYARRFNDRYEARGHLFGSRYGAVLIESDPQLLAVLRYIALNPVDAGICSRPDAYPWSSHAPTLAGSASTILHVDRLFWHLAGFGGDPRIHYESLIDTASSP